jgi:signal transduction histidine kinase
MRDIPGENTPENIQAIIDETTRLSELVNDMLDISRIESGTEKFEAENFDLTAAVSEVICRYDKMKSVRSYDIRFDYESNVTVFADRGMILQVIYNLINNAINYSGDDKFVGVAQTVKTDGAGNGFVKISVTDHGVGIEKDNLPLIWDRYYKVDSVHKRAKVGSGLGLSIVKKVLEKHSAAYGVDSTVGEGSVFWFELPISKK